MVCYRNYHALYQSIRDFALVKVVKEKISTKKQNFRPSTNKFLPVETSDIDNGKEETKNIQE